MKKTILIIFMIFLIVPIVLANNLPKLIDGGAQPPFGKPGILVTYRIEYVDDDGDAPKYVRVYFPDGPKEMKKISGDYKTGAMYEFSWQQYESLEFYFEASDGEVTKRFPDYEGSGLAPINILTEIPENNKIYFFSREGKEPLWSYNTGKDWVHKVVISDDGNYIAAKTTDFIYFFSKDGKLLWKHQCIEDTGKNENPAGWISVSSDGSYIGGACPNYLNLFSKNGKSTWYYESELTKKGSIYSSSMSSDGEYIVIGTMGTNAVILFSKNSNKPLWEFKGQGDMHGLAISDDGSYIAAGAHCPDRRAFLFSKESNKPLVSYVSSEDSPVWTADISNGYAVYGLDGTGIKGVQDNIFLVSPDKNEPFRGYAVPGWVRSVSISDDGKYIAAGSAVDYSVYLFDRDLDKEIWKYKTGGKVGSASISSNGSYIVAGSKDKNIYLFSKENNELLWIYNAGEWVNTIEISGDGKYIVAGTGASQYLSEGHTISDTEEEAQMKPVCGDGICVSGEGYGNCPQDCKAGEVKKAVCGDGVCDYSVEAESCPRDCIAKRKEISREDIKKETYCGNDICEEPEENKDNCPEDCFVAEGKEKKGLFKSVIDFFRRLFGR